jgi:hypothetical protein
MPAVDETVRPTSENSLGGVGVSPAKQGGPLGALCRGRKNDIL